MPEMSLQHTPKKNKLVNGAIFLTSTKQVSSVNVNWDNGCHDLSLLHLPNSLQVNDIVESQLCPNCFQILYNSSFKFSSPFYIVQYEI